MKFEFKELVSTNNEKTLAFIRTEIDGKYTVYMTIIRKKDGGVFASLPSRKFFDDGPFQPLFAVHNQSDFRALTDAARDFYEQSTKDATKVVPMTQDDFNPDGLPF
jgi:DNA-binding cell septation regulator SpoVG